MMIVEKVHHFLKDPVLVDQGMGSNRLMLLAIMRHERIVFIYHLINHQGLCRIGQSDWTTVAG